MFECDSANYSARCPRVNSGCKASADGRREIADGGDLIRKALVGRIGLDWMGRNALGRGHVDRQIMWERGLPGKEPGGGNDPR